MEAAGSLEPHDGAADFEEHDVIRRVHDESDAANELIDRHGHAVDLFREEYQQLYEAAVASAGSAELARKRKDQLTAELTGHREKLGNLETYEEDAKNSRANLLATLETMQQQLAEIANREVQKREAAVKLRAEIEAASSRIASGPGWTSEQEMMRKELLAHAGDLQREVEVKQRDHLTLRSEVSTIALHVERKQEQEAVAREHVEALEAQAARLREEAQAEALRKANLEEFLIENQARAKRDQELYKNQRACLKTETEYITAVEEQLSVAKEEMERCLGEYDELFRTIQRLSDELDAQTAANASLQVDIINKKNATEAALVKLRALEKARLKCVRLKILAQTKIDEAEASRQGHEGRRDALKAEMHNLRSTELKAGRKGVEMLNRQIGELAREKAILDRKRESSDRAASLTYDLTKANQSTLKGLADDREAMRQSIRGLRTRIEQLAKDRAHAEKEALEHTRRWRERMEELMLQGEQVSHLQRKIAAAMARLKQQQNLYEAVRSDRNIYSKNLIETQDVIKGMKQRFKIMNHQIEQLKDEITVMDHSLVKEHFHHHNVDKDKESLRNEVTKVKKQIVSGEHIALHQRAELQKLTRIIQEADEERQRQIKEHDAIVGEKGVLFGQLMKRNDELTTLYDKIRIQTSGLHQGEVRYQQLLLTIRDLEEQLKAMEAELVQSMSQAGDLGELKTATNKLEKDLRRERGKITALVEELELPLNVHRWRKLESSDPERYDLVCKAQSLQRSLVSKTESCVRKDLLIQEKEKLYVELKNILGRQPGPDVADQLAIYQENLKHKVKQMKAMEAELDMYKQQVDLFKSDIETAGVAMRALRQRWVAEQRRASKQGKKPISVWDSSGMGTVAAAPIDGSSGTYRAYSGGDGGGREIRDEGSCVIPMAGA